jgi:hypothetical protein
VNMGSTTCDRDYSITVVMVPSIISNNWHVQVLNLFRAQTFVADKTLCRELIIDA